jgi:hypothetical protein
VGHHDEVAARRLIAVTVVALLGGLCAGPASAGQRTSTPRQVPTATTIGQTGPAPFPCSTAVPAAVLLTTEGAGGATYTAPRRGVLTSFTHQANNVAGQVRAIVFASATGTSKRVVAASAKETVRRNVTNIFGVRLPIRSGQQLGLGYTVSGMACAETGVAGDVTAIAAPFDPDTSSTFTPTGTLSPGNLRPNISAVLEPDRDKDGYGDISQDGCSASAKIQVVCPETTITKRPKRYRTSSKVKVKFTSSVAGSTFECKLDRHKYKPCTSPYKKHWGRGRHTLKVRAVSPAGVRDPKPAKVKVTIRK